jgi:hypothetical protein
MNRGAVTASAYRVRHKAVPASLPPPASVSHSRSGCKFTVALDVVFAAAGIAKAKIAPRHHRVPGTLAT